MRGGTAWYKSKNEHCVSSLCENSSLTGESGSVRVRADVMSMPLRRVKSWRVGTALTLSATQLGAHALFNVSKSWLLNTLQK
jgi:hypothetical protein